MRKSVARQLPKEKETMAGKLTPGGKSPNAKKKISSNPMSNYNTKEVGNVAGASKSNKAICMADSGVGSQITLVSRPGV